MDTLESLQFACPELESVEWNTYRALDGVQKPLERLDVGRARKVELKRAV
jgi:hypothetical protein